MNNILKEKVNFESFGPLLKTGVSGMDAALGGGLALGALHELEPARPLDFGAPLGFGLALASRLKQAGTILSVQQDMAALEGGALYGEGCAHFGCAPDRFLLLRAHSSQQAIWAMEEGLRACAFTAVFGELAAEGEKADLTATRRLTLAAQSGNALVFLLRQRGNPNSSAACTRWRISGAQTHSDGFGGLGHTAFAVTLMKNKRGPCGSWVVEWNKDEQRFFTADTGAVAQPVFDRPHRTRRAG